MVAAGRMDTAFAIERMTVIQDETGQPVETWADWVPLWFGAVSDLRGDERLQSNQELATETTTITGHFVEGVRAVDRLRRLENGRRYDIIGIAEIGRRAGLQLTAKANV